MLARLTYGAEIVKMDARVSVELRRTNNGDGADACRVSPRALASPVSESICEGISSVVAEDAVGLRKKSARMCSRLRSFDGLIEGEMEE